MRMKIHKVEVVVVAAVAAVVVVGVVGLRCKMSFTVQVTSPLGIWSAALEKVWISIAVWTPCCCR